ncbi:MAG: GntR family transcriptional regulator [Steroidobacteraceae bacterium]
MMSARAPKALRAIPLSKQEQAYQLVRQRIERGEYPPGQRLVLDQLAGDLGMSQVPIREAIRRLEAEGWLTYELNSGATVAPLNLETWTQLLESVAVTEGYATALAAPHVTASDVRELAAINKRMRAALREESVQEFSDANRAFHTCILSRCPNAIMVGQLRQSQARLDSLSRALFSREQGVLLRLLGPKMGQIAVADHEALIAALRQDAAPAVIERLTREHVLVHLRAAREEFSRKT